MQPHGELPADQQDIHTYEQPHHQNDDCGETAVDRCIIRKVFDKNRKEGGEENPARRRKCRAPEGVPPRYLPPRNRDEHQPEEKEQNHKAHQRLKFIDDPREYRRQVSEQPFIEHVAEYEQADAHEQDHRERQRVNDRERAHEKVIAFFRHVEHRVQALDQREHACGGRPHADDRRHREDALRRADLAEQQAQQLVHRRGHHVCKGEQQRRILEADQLRQGEQEHQKRNEGD